MQHDAGGSSPARSNAVSVELVGHAGESLNHDLSALSISPYTRVLHTLISRPNPKEPRARPIRETFSFQLA